MFAKEGSNLLIGKCNISSLDIIGGKNSFLLIPIVNYQKKNILCI
jgi:hypothetical protein